MGNLEEKVDNSGFFDWLWKRKLLRNFAFSAATVASVFFGSRDVNAQQSTTLNHDPILLIHGLDIDFRDNNIEYCDFNTDRVVSFEDFVGFSKKFGSKRGDSRYDEGYDIDRNDEVGFSDFVILSKNFNSTVNPLESTWDELAIALIKDLNWKSGGTVGRWISTENTKIGDFYYLRLSSGNKLTFDQQGDEVKFAVEEINKITGRKVILTGFSMGGLAARAYLQNNPDPKASALVTICTPHVGSYLAHLTAGKSEILDWQSRFKDKFWTEKEAQLLLAYVDVAAKDKPVIKHLAPCADSLQILNNNIYRMPSNLQYVNVVSQVPDQEALDHVLELINKYLLDYQTCKQVASPGLLAKGDGVVPLVSQSLVYAVLNTPTSQNISWYEQAKGNITENSEMQVSHLDGNKQISVLEKVLMDVINKREKLFDGTILSVQFYYTSDIVGLLHGNGDFTNLFSLSDHYTDVSFFPDHKRFLYNPSYDGRRHLWMADINGKNKTLVSDLDVRSLDCGPNNLIVVERFPGSIWIVNPLTKNETEIVPYINKPFDIRETNRFPNWSHDGSAVYFLRDKSRWENRGYKSSVEICFVKSDGSDERVLFSSGNREIEHPSPYGTKLHSVYGSKAIYTLVGETDTSKEMKEVWIYDDEIKKSDLLLKGVFGDDSNIYGASDFSFIDNGKRIFIFSNDDSFIFDLNSKTRRNLGDSISVYTGDWTSQEF